MRSQKVLQTLSLPAAKTITFIITLPTLPHDRTLQGIANL